MFFYTHRSVNKASFKALWGWEGQTMSLMGLSSSMSMGTLVLWIQVLVHRCLSRTYEFLEDKTVLLFISLGFSVAVHTYSHFWFFTDHQCTHQFAAESLSFKKKYSFHSLINCNQVNFAVCLVLLIAIKLLSIELKTYCTNVSHWKPVFRPGAA